MGQPNLPPQLPRTSYNQPLPPTTTPYLPQLPLTSYNSSLSPTYLLQLPLTHLPPYPITLLPPTNSAYLWQLYLPPTTTPYLSLTPLSYNCHLPPTPPTNSAYLWATTPTSHLSLNMILVPFFSLLSVLQVLVLLLCLYSYN